MRYQIGRPEYQLSAHVRHIGKFAIGVKLNSLLMNQNRQRMENTVIKQGYFNFVFGSRGVCFVINLGAAY